MKLFSEWLLSKEGSATSRARDAWARYGAYPISAGFSSHSSGPAFVWDKLSKELPKAQKNKKNAKKRKNK
jgi:hypothetical protein